MQMLQVLITRTSFYNLFNNVRVFLEQKIVYFSSAALFNGAS